MSETKYIESDIINLRGFTSHYGGRPGAPTVVLSITRVLDELERLRVEVARATHLERQRCWALAYSVQDFKTVAEVAELIRRGIDNKDAPEAGQ